LPDMLARELSDVGPGRCGIVSHDLKG